MAAASRPACASRAEGHIRFPLLNSPERRRQVRTVPGETDATPKRPKRRPNRRGKPLRDPQLAGTPSGFLMRSDQRPSTHSSPPLGAHGVFPCACRAFSDAAPAMDEPWPGAVLRWFSQLTAAPRKPYSTTQKLRCINWNFYQASFAGIPLRDAQDEPGHSLSRAFSSFVSLLSSHLFFSYTHRPSCRDQLSGAPPPFPPGFQKFFYYGDF